MDRRIRCMLHSRVLGIGAIFAVMSWGQAPSDKYGALKKALALSDEQLAQVQAPLLSNPPAGAPVRTESYARRGGLPALPKGDSRRRALLTASQLANLDEIEKSLTRYDAVAFSLEYGLIDRKLWPSDFFLCPCLTIRCPYAAELQVNDSQLHELLRLKTAAIAAGTQNHDASLAVLNGAQRVKHTLFEDQLAAANQAVELGLIRLLRVEFMCH